MKTRTQCLITGGAGFIGSHLCDALIDKGLEVFCIDNLITGTKKNISHLLTNRNFHFIFYDITKPLTAGIVRQLSSIKYLYHLASPASPPQYKKYALETLLVNSIGTYYMLELSRKTDSSFLLASTSEVYGNPLQHPQKETYFGNVNSVGVRACYDESKRFAEALTMEYRRKFGLKIRIIRVFNTYGPRMQPDDGRVISNFITAAISSRPLYLYGDGKQTRSFCYISDMIDGLCRVMENEKAIGKVINLGNPDEKTIRKIGRIILKLTKSVSIMATSEREEDDPFRRKPDIALAIKLTGWRPQVMLTDGLKKTINYFHKL